MSWLGTGEVPMWVWVALLCGLVYVLIAWTPEERFTYLRDEVAPAVFAAFVASIVVSMLIGFLLSILNNPQHPTLPDAVTIRGLYLSVLAVLLTVVAGLATRGTE